MRILVVDDSEMVRAILKRWCVVLGVRESDVIEAANGQIGLTRFDKDAFDAIITDWSMPVMDGLAFVKEIRTRNPQIPIVMVTSEADREQVTAAVQSGVNDYLVKPFTPGALRDKISSLIATVATRSQECGPLAQSAPPAPASASVSRREKVGA